MRDAALLGVFIAMVGFAGWSIMTKGGKPSTQPARTDREAVNAWLVTCPGLGGLMVFSVGADGRLTTPPEISPASLPRVEGEEASFAFGEIAVRFEGRDAEVTRDGETIRCTPPDPPR